MTATEDGDIENDKKAMVAAMIDLHREITLEIQEDQLNPGKMMRLLGAGMNQCLVALTHLLLEKPQ